MENIDLNKVPSSEGSMSQPFQEQEVQPRISVREVTPEPVILSRDVYDSLINDLTKYKARVIELQAQVERQNTEIRMLSMGRRQDMEVAASRQNEIHNQWLGTSFLLNEERRKNTRLRAIIAANHPQPNVNQQPPNTQNPPSVNQPSPNP